MWTHRGRNCRIRCPFLRSLWIPSSRRRRIGNILLFLPGWLGRCPTCEYRHVSLPRSGRRRRNKLQLLLVIQFLLQPKSIHFYLSNLRACRSDFGNVWSRLANLRQDVSILCQPLVVVCFWGASLDLESCVRRGLLLPKGRRQGLCDLYCHVCWVLQHARCSFLLAHLLLELDLLPQD